MCGVRFMTRAILAYRLNDKAKHNGKRNMNVFKFVKIFTIAFAVHKQPRPSLWTDLRRLRFYPRQLYAPRQQSLVVRRLNCYSELSG